MCLIVTSWLELGFQGLERLLILQVAITLETLGEALSVMGRKVRHRCSCQGCGGGLLKGMSHDGACSHEVLTL